jgi:hypothetical protein
MPSTILLTWANPARCEINAALMLRFPLWQTAITSLVGSSSLILTAECSDDTLQALFGLLGDRANLLVADDAEHGLWVGNVYVTPRALCAHDDITREQQADIQFLLKRTVRQWRVAGPQEDWLVDVPFSRAAKAEICLRVSPAPQFGQVAVELLALIGTSRSKSSLQRSQR